MIAQRRKQLNVAVQLSQKTAGVTVMLRLNSASALPTFMFRTIIIINIHVQWPLSLARAAHIEYLLRAGNTD